MLTFEQISLMLRTQNEWKVKSELFRYGDIVEDDSWEENGNYYRWTVINYMGKDWTIRQKNGDTRKITYNKEKKLDTNMVVV